MQEASRESSITVLTKISPPNIVGRMMIQIAVVVGGLMLVSVLSGRALDANFKTSPLFSVVITFLGTVASAYLTYKLGLRAVEKSNTVSTAPKPDSHLSNEEHRSDDENRKNETHSDTV
jgi:F0F1-type ATP synthase assembly protein I